MWPDRNFYKFEFEIWVYLWIQFEVPVVKGMIWMENDGLMYVKGCDIFCQINSMEIPLSWSSTNPGTDRTLFRSLSTIFLITFCWETFQYLSEYIILPHPIIHPPNCQKEGLGVHHKSGTAGFW